MLLHDLSIKTIQSFLHGCLISKDKDIHFYLEPNPPFYEYGASKMVCFHVSACCLFDDDQAFL